MKITKKLLREIIEEEVNTLILEKKFGQVSPENLKFFSRMVPKLGSIEWSSDRMAQRDSISYGYPYEIVTAYVTFPGAIDGEVKLYVPKL